MFLAPEKLHPAQRARLDQFATDTCVDIHCHCLPGIDDGPSDMEGSIALCRALVEDGVTEVVATPHQLGQSRLNNMSAPVRAAVVRLREELEIAQVPLLVHAGGDVRLDPRLPELLALDAVLTLADGKKYVLLELPHEILINLTPLLVRLKSAGISVVLSHPERHRVLAREPIHLLRWLEQGIILQITSGSLIGDFGELAQSAAWDWLGSGLVAVVASDAHGKDRPPRMTPAIDSIVEQLGQGVARRVCIENPERIVRGELVVTSPQRVRLVGR